MKSTWGALFVSVCILSSATAVHGQGLPADFQKLLGQNSLRYAIPSGFKSAPVKDNPDVKYDFAVKSTSEKLEIRYLIERSQQTQDLHSIMAMTMGLNISDGENRQPKEYPLDAVKAEFGADAGCSTIVHCNSAFGKGYKFCMISTIHRNNLADAFAFFLADDLQVLMKAIATDKVYHALRFK